MLPLLRRPASAPLHKWCIAAAVDAYVGNELQQQRHMARACCVNAQQLRSVDLANTACWHPVSNTPFSEGSVNEVAPAAVTDMCVSSLSVVL